MKILKTIRGKIREKYNSLKESYHQGERKALYENSSHSGITLAGAGGPIFDAWVKQVYAPYIANEKKAAAILEPQGTLEKILFKAGYKKIKLN